MRQHWLSIVFLMLLGPALLAQQRLVLRDTTLVKGVIQVQNLDGVTILEDGKTKSFGWDEIESGVAANQAQFDSLLRDIGDPLFRIRQRLKSGDYQEMASQAEKLFPLFADRNSATAEAVCFATHLARDQKHEREMALEPLLVFLALRSVAGNGPESRFVAAGSRKITVLPSGFAQEFTPVFFDSAAARAALPGVMRRLEKWPGGKPSLGARVYAATLAICARDEAIANTVQASLRNMPGSAEWLVVLAAQREIEAGKAGEAVEQLLAKMETMTEPARMVALYWSGMARLKGAPPNRAAVIALLSLPAKYPTASTELSAACLYHAATVLEKNQDARATVALRKELLTRFRFTSFGSRLARESTLPNPGGLR